MNETMDTLDLTARYSVAGYRGIAFYLVGWAQQYVPYTFLVEDDDGVLREEDDDDGEMEDDTTMVRAIMVGDDIEHIVAVGDLTMIDDDDYCSGCGQIGCGWS